MWCILFIVFVVFAALLTYSLCQISGHHSRLEERREAMEQTGFVACSNCNGLGRNTLCKDGINCGCAAMDSGAACERATSVVCPVCKGVCGVESAPNDWHDCERCDASGSLPIAVDLAEVYLK